MDFIIIGISGNFRSGKNTFGDMLEEIFTHMSIPVKQFAFADPLKNMAKKYFDWDGNKNKDFKHVSPFPYGSEEYDERPKGTYLGGRSLLQGIGEMLRVEVGNDFWINKCIEDIRSWVKNTEYSKSYASTYVAIITDVRYMNEAEILTAPESKLSANAELLYVQRPGFQGDEHPSEAELRTDEFKACVTQFIDNSKTLEDLKKIALEVGSKIARRCLENGEARN